jgi:hypothetical protein
MIGPQEDLVLRENTAPRSLNATATGWLQPSTARPTRYGVRAEAVRGRHGSTAHQEIANIDTVEALR